MANTIISDPSSSIWVNASAGSGKTKILIDRVLSLLLNGININKILCLTFTNVAAQEMVTRIENLILEWSVSDLEELRESLIKILSREPNEIELINAKSLFEKLISPLNELKIKTIHGFCHELIKKFPFEMDISPNLELLDEISLKELLKEAKNKLLLEGSEEISQSISNIFSESSDHKLNNIINYIIEHQEKISLALNSSNNESLFEKIAKFLGLSSQTNYLEKCQEFCLRQMDLLNHVPIYLSTELSSAKDRNRQVLILEWYHEDMEKKIEQIGDYLQIFFTKNGDLFHSFFSSSSLKILNGEKDFFDKIIDSCLEFKEFSDNYRLYKNSVSFISIARYLLNFYQKYKDLNNKIDYHDIIHKVILLLNSENQSSWPLYKLNYQIEHILLDEAQDTNYPQWLIIDGLCRDFFSGSSANEKEKSLFIVGDVKQTIFSFQGAEAEIFQGMKIYFREKLSQISGKFEEFSLNRSYRSAKNILYFIDKIFNSQNLVKNISFDETLFHQSTRDNHPGTVTILPLVKYFKFDPFQQDHWLMPESSFKKRNSDQVLARLIAYTIDNWLKSKKTLPNQGRLVEEKDIMILVRKRTDFVDYFLNYCQTLAIKTSGKDRINLNNHIIFQDLISLAKFVLLPEDDLNLACLLKSPFIGFTEEELFNICYNRQNSLWNNLVIFSKKNQIYEKAYNFLYSYFNKSDFPTPFEFFYEVLEVDNHKENFLKKYGIFADDIIKQFLFQAKIFEKDHITSMQLFVQWFENSEKSVKRNIQNSEGIKIMTIHSSKGLQSPIVILADTTDIPGLDEEILWEQDELLPIWPIKRQNFSSKCLGLISKLEKRQLDEYYRLLYVALTRAEDEILVAGKEKFSKLSPNCWYNLIKDSVNEPENRKYFDLPVGFSKEDFVSEEVIQI